MKFMWIAAAAVLVTTVAHAQTITEKQLTDAMASVADYQKKDEFDVGPNKQLLLGQSFSIRIPLSKYGSRNSSFIYSYDVKANKLKLEIKTTPYIPPWTGKMVFWRGFTIAKVSEDRGEFEAQNSFGASVAVKAERTTTYIVGSPKPFAADRLPPSETKELILPPDEARALASTMELVLEGTVTSYDGSNTMDCSKHEREPTVSDPYLIEERTCFLSATITRMAIEQKNAGAGSGSVVRSAVDKQAWLDVYAAKLAGSFPMKAGDVTLSRVQSSDMVLLIGGESAKAISSDNLAYFLRKTCSDPGFLQVLGNDAAIRFRLYLPQVAEPMDIDLTKTSCAQALGADH